MTEDFGRNYFQNIFAKNQIICILQFNNKKTNNSMKKNLNRDFTKEEIYMANE